MAMDTLAVSDFGRSFGSPADAILIINEWRFA
jgi:hypothetical protein